MKSERRTYPPDILEDQLDFEELKQIALKFKIKKGAVGRIRTLLEKNIFRYHPKDMITNRDAAGIYNMYESDPSSLYQYGKAFHKLLGAYFLKDWSGDWKLSLSGLEFVA